MAVKTKAVMLSDSNSTFANASNITAEEHRAFNTDLIDSYENFIGSYTTLQILAIASPTLRQIVFDTTLNVYYFWDGTRWVEWAKPKYKVYVALLTQTGTSAPVATVLENTLGGTIVWSYDAVGQYSATLAGAFTASKTIILSTSVSIIRGAIMDLTRTSANALLLQTGEFNFAGSSIDAADDILDNMSVEIRVYY